MIATAQNLISIFLALVLGHQVAQASPSVLINVNNDRANVRGTVHENVMRCQMDGPCYLTLNDELSSVRVYYHHGEYPPCTNQRLINIGLNITSGDTIEAVGVYSVVNGIHTIDMCCPDCNLTVTNY